MYILPILREVSIFKDANIALNKQAANKFNSQGTF